MSSRENTTPTLALAPALMERPIPPSVETAKVSTRAPSSSTERPTAYEPARIAPKLEPRERALLETRTEGSKEADTGANTKARMPTDESGRVSRQVPTAQASPREEREVRETKEKDRPSEASSLSSASVAAVPADSSAERDRAIKRRRAAPSHPPPVVVEEPPRDHLHEDSKRSSRSSAGEDTLFKKHDPPYDPNEKRKRREKEQRESSALMKDEKDRKEVKRRRTTPDSDLSVTSGHLGDEAKREPVMERERERSSTSAASKAKDRDRDEAGTRRRRVVETSRLPIGSPPMSLPSLRESDKERDSSLNQRTFRGRGEIKLQRDERRDERRTRRK